MVPSPATEYLAILRGNVEIDLDSTEEYYSSDPTGVFGT